ncbi:PucR-like helix-turn-helix protein [Scopulibacillus darangshiensis]|uniref:PucR-like helix-turn-helix protein n=1 Tax=Scopulibacillus darangshiensis TaxID=442528 RepID=A0A4R2NH71_9BACL|nr:PucR family transcriptional regulator [Scopulibacillus darangshiensis]TCP20717.1 PucR-like helix-turn-helix protein [Scopulibacillus darangshiensis]
MITVKEALRLPELDTVTVRAGKSGLFRKIRWAHVIDHDDMQHFLEGGELLLTCGQVWPQDKKLEDQLIKGFQRYKISGILFATGVYLKECPPAVVTFGEKYAIPVLEVPFQVPFVKITHTIHLEILNRQIRNKELTDQLPLELTQNLKHANSRIDVCKTLSESLKCPVVTTDQTNNILDKVIPANGKLADIPHLMNKLTHEFENLYFYNNHREKGESENKTKAIVVRAASPPHAMAVPLQVGEIFSGAIWLLNFSQQLEERHALALEHAAAVLLDINLNNKEVEITRKQLRLELLELLIEKPLSAETVIENRMRKLGLEPKANWIVGFVLSGNNAASSSEASLNDVCKKWIDQSETINGFCEAYEGQWTLLLTSNLEHPELQDQFNHFYDYLQGTSKKMVPVLVYGGIKTEMAAIFESYQDARTLAPIVQYLSPSGGVYLADHFRRELALYGGVAPDKAQEFRNLILPEELLSERGAALYETLKCLASHNYNRESVAKALYIHRNTLRYRIERIEKLLQDSLSSPKCKFWIQVAIDLEPLTMQTD